MRARLRDGFSARPRPHFQDDPGGTMLRAARTVVHEERATTVGRSLARPSPAARTVPTPVGAARDVAAGGRCRARRASEVGQQLADAVGPLPGANPGSA